MARGLTRKILIGVAALAVLGGLAVGGLKLHESRATALAQTPKPVAFPWALRTAKVVKRDLTAGFPVLATLNSSAEVSITPQISGVIREIGPHEGEPVVKGAVLVRLDTRELQSQLTALKANLKAAVDQAALRLTDLDRQEKLLKKGFATREEVDTLRTARRTADQQVKQLKAEIAALRTRVKYGVILAPADGVVAARLQEPGDLAAPGRAILRITAATGAKIRITVPQDVATRVKKGSEVRLDYGAQSVSVKVSRVFPSLNAQSMGSAEADLADIPFGLPSGARLPGRVVLDRWPGATIAPRNALILSADGKSATLFRIVDGAEGAARLERVAVEIVASGREGVAVSGGLKAGDLIAIAQESELLKLADGDPVTPEPARGQ